MLDLTPADGCLALAAYKADIIYVGVCFNDEHKARLMNKVERNIWKSMTSDEDPIYDARLVAAFTSSKSEGVDDDNKVESDAEAVAPKRRARPKATSSKAKANPKRCARRRTEQGADGRDEGDGDDVDEEEGEGVGGEQHEDREELSGQHNC